MAPTVLRNGNDRLRKGNLRRRVWESNPSHIGGRRVLPPLRRCVSSGSDGTRSRSVECEIADSEIEFSGQACARSIPAEEEGC